jgi:hypothetical protein
MIEAPGDHPLPHPELPAQTPLIFKLHEGKLHEGEVLYRHRQSVHDSLFFGTTGNYRFDDPVAPHRGRLSSFMRAPTPSAVCWNHVAPRPEYLLCPASIYLDARQIARMEPTTGSRQALIKSLNNGPRY